MRVEETKEKKKVLITYFENYGIFDNKLCTSIYKILKEKYKEKNESVHFLKLKTTCNMAYIETCTFEKLIETLFKNQYDYVISIGKYTHNIFERRKEYDNCYIFTEDEISKVGFIIKEGPAFRDLGTCFKVRDILFYYAILANRNSKVEFIHIGRKYKKTPDKFTNFLIEKIDTLIQ